MDTLRGHIGSFDDHTGAEDHAADLSAEDTGHEAPPSPVGQDERRMQVRAYNHWASLLQDRSFPSIEDLDPAALPDFGPYSVLLDFTGGVENPAIQFLGDALAEECGTGAMIRSLESVPSRSLLSRITDHYMQILANQAPIGFEAEFVNQRGATILYRGILLPFSSDDDTIDFIYGVINWKEVADQLTADELLLEIDQALDSDAAAEALPNADPAANDEAGTGSESLAGWGDAPDGDDEWLDEDESEAAEFSLPDIGDADEEDTIDHEAYASLMPSEDDEPAGLVGLGGLGGLRSKPAKKPLDLSGAQTLAPLDGESAPTEAIDDFPAPAFGQDAPDRFAELLTGQEDDEEGDSGEPDNWNYARDLPATPAQPLGLGGDMAPQPASAAADNRLADNEPAAVEADADHADPGLHDTLAEARELALIASSTEDRSRSALYDAVSRAYDVSLVAQEAPQDFAELLAESGLTAQERAPMTPVVKLVFGADYDKTRLTEYAAVLSHAHRHAIARGGLREFLARADGGLKGVVQAERRQRREEEGKVPAPAKAVRAALAKQLRALEPHGFDAIDPEGPEFGVVVIRRLGNGEIAVLGDCSDDVPLVERAARKLVA